MSKGEKSLYRVQTQTEDLTVTFKFDDELSYEAAAELAKVKIKSMESFNEKVRPFVLTEITTKERWERGTINFCPRCGDRLVEELDTWGRFGCFDCGAYCLVQIDVEEDDEC